MVGTKTDGDIFDDQVEVAVQEIQREDLVSHQLF